MTQLISPRRFEIDNAGYKRHMKEVEPFRVVQEIISNSFDESSVKNIEVSITQDRDLVIVKVTDDGVGFVDINDAFTMYKHSYKRKYKNKIGKFNLGEKQFFVLCEYGYVKSRNKMIEFQGEQRIEDDTDQPKGTVVYAEFKWSAEDVKEILRMGHKLIVPEGKTLTINNTPVRKLEWIKSIENAVLFTEIENSDTLVMRRIKSATTIDLYLPKEGERPWLYGLGVPVQQLKHSMQWHVNIMQKIPLGVERDKASESWLEDLYTEIINRAPELIDKDNAGSKWVRVGLSNAEEGPAKHVMTTIFGDKPIFFKSTNHYANEQAIESGGQLVPDNLFDRETKQNLAGLGIAQYAGEVFRTMLVDGKRFDPTDQMVYFTQVMKLFARDAGIDVSFGFVTSPEASTLAQESNGKITFNIAHLGKNYFDNFTEENLGLTLHEMAHIKDVEEGDSHLSMDYVHELQRLAGLIGLKGIDYYVRQVVREQVRR